MKLDRSLNSNGRGKYALLRLRRMDDFVECDDPWQKLPDSITSAIKTLEDAGILDWGVAETKSEFMVIRLRDKYSRAALLAYADAAKADDQEYANDISEMADRAGPLSPWCKKPD